jgi:hypothetical protein
MSESYWTRERKLTEEGKSLLQTLSRDTQSLRAELRNGDWEAASRTSVQISVNTARMKDVTNELELVTDIIDAYERIEARMKLLEEQINVSDN